MEDTSVAYGNGSRRKIVFSGVMGILAATLQEKKDLQEGMTVGVTSGMSGAVDHQGSNLHDPGPGILK